MSRPRIPRARSAFSLALLASGAAALGGCSGSAPTASSAASSAAPSTPAANAAHPAGSVGGQSVGATAAATTAAAVADGASSASYALSTPSSIGAWPLITPTSSEQAKLQQGLSEAESLVGDGVSGTPVTGLYDDAADRAWIGFVGLNGSGFDEADLAKAAEAAPRSFTNAAGDLITVTWVSDVSGGPDGGQTDCEQVTGEQTTADRDDLGLAAIGTACLWMTPTTFGAISVYPQADSVDAGEGYDAQQLDGFLLMVRAAVEHRR